MGTTEARAIYSMIMGITVTDIQFYVKLRPIQQA